MPVAQEIIQAPAIVQPLPTLTIVEKPVEKVITETPPVIEVTLEPTAPLSSWQDILNRFALLDCPLRQTAKHFLFSAGDLNAPYVWIDEVPDTDEEYSGSFWSPHRQAMVDQMLIALKIRPSDVLFLRLVPWRPPGNRPATIEETKQCLPFLQQALQVIQPQKILMMGRTVADRLFPGQIQSQNIRDVRGSTFDLDLDGHKMKALATFRLQHIQDIATFKPLFWRDLKAWRLI